jgi:hypothetical protein
VLWSLGTAGNLDLCPLDGEVCECLRLNGGLRSELDGERPEFNCLLGDSTSRVWIVQYVSEQELGDHRDRVVLEVVAQLAGGDEYSIEKLLNLRVAYL